MRELIATRGFVYQTRRLMAGDSFTASPQWAQALIAVGRARPAPASQPAEALEAAPEAAPAAALEAAPEAPEELRSKPISAMKSSDLPPKPKRKPGRPRKHPKRG